MRRASYAYIYAYVYLKQKIKGSYRFRVEKKIIKKKHRELLGRLPHAWVSG